MKNITKSLIVIGAVAAIVIGGTIAYFSDTETSNGNIFTAGAIDLKVDHTLQTYNGVDCKTCSVEVFSSISTKVVEASEGASNQGPFPMSALDVSSPHPNWLSEDTLAPAQWIWATDPTTVADTTNGATYTFENKFQWNGTVSSVDLNLAFASDNGYKVILNGTTIVDKLSSEYNYNGSTISLSGGEETLFIANMIPNGENTLQIAVRNKPLAGDPVTANPAGLLFKLNIQRPQGECVADSYFQRNCTLWQSKDLGENNHFWMFDDVKPGDYGTNVISLHVDSNDAYVCMINDPVIDEENGVVDPEITAEDDQNSSEGELSDYMQLFIWNDENGDGVYDPTKEANLYEGDFTPTEMIKMSLPTGGTDYLGVAWCMGNQTVNPSSGVISCDGVGDQNNAQTDKMFADVVFYAEQQRNNEDFSCSSVNLPQEPEDKQSEI